MLTHEEITYLVKVGNRGLRVNRPVLEAATAEAINVLDKAQNALNQAAGRIVIAHSNDDVSSLLFVERGNKEPSAYGSRTKTGKVSLTVTSLQNISDPIAQLLIDVRKAQSQVKYFTIANKFRVGDRISYEFEHQKAATFRLYAKNPSVMSFPGDIRKCIVPDDGNTFVFADYDRQELCLMAYASMERKFFEERDAGLDIFSFLSESSDVPREKVKLAIYAYLYGAKLDSLVWKTGATGAQVQKFLGAFLTRYPELAEFPRRAIAKVTQNLTAVTIYGNGEMNGAGEPDYEKAVRRLVNFMVQGAGGMILRELIRQISQLDWMQFKVSGHDSVMVEVPTARAEEGKLKLRELMEGIIPGVLKATPITGKTWFDVWNGENETEEI